jgi:hypothetical protein
MKNGEHYEITIKGNFFTLMLFKLHRLYISSCLKIYRQTDTDFISVLNNLRNNTITTADVAALNKYVNLIDLKENKGYITLTTHNAKADAMNAQALQI